MPNNQLDSIQETGKKREQNRRRRDELNSLYRGIAWPHTAHDRLKWRNGKEDRLERKKKTELWKTFNKI